MFELALVMVAVLAGAVAAIAGFGIGSLLTPLLAWQVGTKTAVAAVSVPYLIGTAIRFWLLRANVDRSVLWRFGLTSAAGGLIGTVLHAEASSPALATLFGALLIFAGTAQVTGFAQRWRFHTVAACWPAPYQVCSAGWSGIRAGSDRRRCSDSA